MQHNAKIRQTFVQKHEETIAPRGWMITVNSKLFDCVLVGEQIMRNGKFIAGAALVAFALAGVTAASAAD